MPSRNRPTYACSDCGAEFPKWVGKCTRCGSFGTVDEKPDASAASTGMRGNLTAGTYQHKAQKVDDVPESEHERIATGIGEFDRVLGGGLVPGQVLLLSGEPGGGKSTLAMQVSASLAEAGHTAVIISGEESVEQIASRARRLGVASDNLLLAGEHSLDGVLAHVEEHSPTFLVVDSVQTISSPHVESRAGSVPQVHEVGSALTRLAKTTNTIILAIAQITKDGGISGPQALVHIVDSVAHLEGESNSTLRIMRMSKNRFGSADETATFQHVETGLEEVPDPSGLYLQSRESSVAGVCPSVMLQGKRAVPVEVQALVAPTNSPNPRRGVTGLDSARMAMLQAVTERHGRVRLFDKDSFLATTAGIKISDTGVDLAACLALASAATGNCLPRDVAAVGEITLSGDTRLAPNMKARLQEAARLGFRRVLCPANTPSEDIEGLTLVRAASIADALRALQGWQSDASKPQ